MTTVPNPKEVAIVSSGDLNYVDWETVMVQHRWMEPYPIFEFSATEPSTEPKTLANLLFFVGQKVTITLGGIQAIFGVITIRQSAMDQERHGLQLIGKGYSWQMVKSSVLHQYDFSGFTILGVAQTIAAETGVGVSTIGEINSDPFPQNSLTVSPGEPAFDFLELACRMRDTVIGSDTAGNILLIGKHSSNQGADINCTTNGNVERINVIISNETVFANYYATGQMAGSDEINGDAASQQWTGPIGGSDPNPSHLVTQSEIPDHPQGLQERNFFEAQIHQGTEIRITVSVYGWLQPTGDMAGDLWRAGAEYKVNAPDHLPNEWNNQKYAAQTVTFQQDDENGTITTLELVLPWLLNGQEFGVGLPGPPPPSDTAQFNNTGPQGSAP